VDADPGIPRVPKNPEKYGKSKKIIFPDLPKVE
jgi:hypothetical protein